MVNRKKMNVRFFPQVIQDLISEFNVEHRPNMRIVMNELLHKHRERIDDSHYCANCGVDSDERYSTNIFWCK